MPNPIAEFCIQDGAPKNLARNSRIVLHPSFTMGAVAVEEPPKRKRDIVPEDEDDKLEIDVSLPEPPSKKAKRKEKKLAKAPAKTATTDDDGETNKDAATPAKPAPTTAQSTERSKYGIWVGNLPFNANKDALRTFLKDKGGIEEADITRLHMPANNTKFNNQGFAYVDFTTEAILQTAIGLSEKLLNGRALLIKNANSFEGRPKKVAVDATAEKTPAAINGKEPSKRVFVGNLSFDVTKDDLAEHFGQAGEIEDVFMATFQDTGKCKGFAWIRFADLEAATSAVKGFILKQEEDDDSDEDEAEEQDSEAKARRKKAKPERYYINRIQGRQLRCEFAEDAQTRYKKRYGKGAARPGRENNDADGEGDAAAGEADARAAPPKKRLDRNLSKDERQEARRKRHDARMVAPGKALANAQRASTAIVAASGKKTTFE